MQFRNLAKASFFILGVFVFYSFSTTWHPSNKDWKKIEKSIGYLINSNIFETVKINNIEGLDPSIQFFQIKESKNIKGYFAIAKAPSKFKRFDFVAFFSVDGDLKKLQILKYREDWGYEICNKRWLEQFTYLNNQSSSKVQIQSISGATISVDSLCAYVDMIRKKLNNFLTQKSIDY